MWNFIWMESLCNVISVISSTPSDISLRNFHAHVKVGRLLCTSLHRLLLLSILILRFTRFVHVSSLLLFPAESSSILWTYCNLLIHLSIAAYLGCFPFLAFRNKADMSILIEVFLWTHVFMFPGSRSGTAGPGVAVCLVTPDLFPEWWFCFVQPPAPCGSSGASTPLPVLMASLFSVTSLCCSHCHL